jgi:hypothetical protein
MFTNEQLKDKISEQDVITFKFRSLAPNTGKPLEPRIHKIREDMTWDDVLAEYSEAKKSSGNIPA